MIARRRPKGKPPARRGRITAPGQPLPFAGPELEFANTEAATNTEAEKTALRQGRAIRRSETGLVLDFPAPPRSGPAPRFRQDCWICRMDRIALRCPAPAPWRGAGRSPANNKPRTARPRAAGCREANGSASAFRPGSVFLSNTEHGGGLIRLRRVRFGRRPEAELRPLGPAGEGDEKKSRPRRNANGPSNPSVRSGNLGRFRKSRPRGRAGRPPAFGPLDALSVEGRKAVRVREQRMGLS